jgi:hypothetical protein
VNGRIQLWRRWWFSLQTGSLAPADALVDRRGESVTLGVREMACRENQAATSFDKAAENLARTAQLVLSGEQLRLLVDNLQYIEFLAAEQDICKKLIERIFSRLQ